MTICGNVEESVDDVRADFAQLHVWEVLFKANIVECIDILLQQILNHFCLTPELQDVLRRVKSHRMTRWCWEL
jgi:hypothetical protein